MCQEPCSIMWVRRVPPFSKPTRRFVPRASTETTRSPRGPGPSRSLRNCVTRAPCSALRSEVAARKMVSPSGILFFFGGQLGGRDLAGALEEPPDSRSESGRLEMGGQLRAGHVFAVDAGDQERAAPAGIDQTRQSLRQRAGPVGAGRLVVGADGMHGVLAPP